MADGMQSNHVLPKHPKFLETVIQPKRNMSAYFWFINNNRQLLLKKNPDFKVTDTAKLAGEIWSKLDDSERARYEELAQNDKLRFEKEMDDMVNLGYFIMPDGSKSSDHQKIVKKKREGKLSPTKGGDYPMSDGEPRSVRSRKMKSLSKSSSPSKSHKSKSKIDEKKSSKSKGKKLDVKASTSKPGKIAKGDN